MPHIDNYEASEYVAARNLKLGDRIATGPRSHSTIVSYPEPSGTRSVRLRLRTQKGRVYEAVVSNPKPVIRQ